MNFDKLTTNLDQQDQMIKLCAEALRKRGQRLASAELMAAADWLESDQGRGLIIDISIASKVVRKVGEP